MYDIDKYDIVLVNVWIEPVNVNPIYHFIRQEISHSTRTLAEQRLREARPGINILSQNDMDILRYQNLLPYSPGLLAIGAAIEQDGGSVKCFSLDLMKKKYDEATWLSESVSSICSMTKYAIGISCVTTEINRAIVLAREIKKNNPLLKVILGGIHPSYFSLDIISENAVDFIVTGEGEETIVDLLRAIKNGYGFESITGLTYKHNGKFEQNVQRPLIDLRKAPIPSYHLLDDDDAKQLLLTPTFSRGCSFTCEYCVESAFWKQTVRHKDPIRFADELQLLSKQYGRRFIHIADSTFGLDKEALSTLLKEIERRKIDSLYSINIRPDVFDYLGEAIVERLINNNFVEFFMGVETSNTNIINDLKRKQSHEIFISTLIKLKQMGAPLVKLYLMVGVPGETHISMQNTILMIRELLEQGLIFYATSKFFVPSPNSVLFNKLGDNIYKEWSKYERYNFPPIYDHNTLSAIELENYHIMLQAIQLSFYLSLLGDSEKSYHKERLDRLVEESYTKGVYL